jgi:hypothetical protein
LPPVSTTPLVPLVFVIPVANKVTIKDYLYLKETVPQDFRLQVFFHGSEVCFKSLLGNVWEESIDSGIRTLLTTLSRAILV